MNTYKIFMWLFGILFATGIVGLDVCTVIAAYDYWGIWGAFLVTSFLTAIAGLAGLVLFSELAEKKDKEACRRKRGKADVAGMLVFRHSDMPETAWMNQNEVYE